MRLYRNISQYPRQLRLALSPSESELVAEKLDLRRIPIGHDVARLLVVMIPIGDAAGTEPRLGVGKRLRCARSDVFESKPQILFQSLEMPEKIHGKVSVD